MPDLKKMKTQHIAFIIIIVFQCFLFSCSQNEKSIPGKAIGGAEAYVMLDLEKVNNPEKEWSYSPKSTTIIGVPFMPRPVQVTYDGAIYTRDAELCFFYGDSLKPVMARQKTFLNGWIPIVQDAWSEHKIDYSMEMFGASVDGIGRDNTIQFVKIKVKNTDHKSRETSTTAGTRFTGQDHRFGKPIKACQPDTRYVMKDGIVWRDDALIYTFPSGSILKAVPGKPYENPFVAVDFDITDITLTGISEYRQVLQPGETFELIFRMPNYPVPSTDHKIIELINRALFDEYRSKTIVFWSDLIERKTTFSMPEKRIENSYKAGLVYLMLSTRMNEDGSIRQGSGLPYDQLFFNDYVDMRRIYDLSDHPEFVAINVQWLIENQNTAGMFLDPVLTHGKEIMASHGQALVSLANHYIATRDNDYGRKVYPTIKKAVDWMQRKHQENPNGLMPASTPFDAEMIKGHYTSHNLWCLLALRDAIRVARGLGETEDENTWLQFHQSYQKSIFTALDASAGNDGYVPTGLYPFITGPEAREGFREHQTDQDWENNLLIYPTEVLEQNDPRIKSTLDTIRLRKYREGIMTYRNGMHLHQYATVNQAHQYLAINDQKHALLDLYHILLHNGSTHEGFENMTEPWEDMDAWPIPPPHAWAAAKISLLIRNMMVREYGGQAGIMENQRDLYLFSVISPSWVEVGNTLSISNAVTEMGLISANLDFVESGATITLNTQFHTAPRNVIIPIPYFMSIKEMKSNASRAMEKDGYLIFSPDVTSIELTWVIRKKELKNAYQDILLSYREENGLNWRGLTDAEIIPGGKGFLLEDEKNYSNELLSFDLVKKAFIKEYTRRFDEYKQAGKRPLTISAPAYDL